MKKSFCDRIKAMELRLENRQIDEPGIYVDNETGLTIKVIGNGLAVPAPITMGRWIDWVEKYYKSTT